MDRSHREIVEKIEGDGIVFNGTQRIGEVEVRLRTWEMVSEYTNARGETVAHKPGFHGASGDMRFTSAVTPKTLLECAVSSALRLEMEDGRVGAIRIQGKFASFEQPKWIQIELAGDLA